MAPLCRFLLVSACLVTAAGFAAAFRLYPYPCLFLLAFVAWKHLRRRPSANSLGTARLASFGTLTRAGLCRLDGGLILGRASLVEPPNRLLAVAGLFSPLTGSEAACRALLSSFGGAFDAGLIRVRDYTHLLTTAPSGAGKSTAVLGPNLLGHPGSCVVIDPKGELFRLTAAHRSKRFGHRIVRIDPLGVAGPAEASDGLNPFDFLDETAKGFLDDCRALADLLVIEKGTEAEPHWNARALDILAAFSAFVCACEADPAKRNLTIVRDLLSSPRKFREVIKVMQTMPDGGVLPLMGDTLTWIQGRELGSVISTVSRHIAWLQSPAVSDCIGKSTFDPRWLWSGKVTVYLCLPHDKLTVLAPLMRLWLGTLLKLVSSRGAGEERPVLFLIDEAAALGKMKPIEEACTLLRGFGVRLWLFYQSLDQLKVSYGDAAPVILDNMGTQQYFGITSFDTADQLSKRIGDATVLVESINRNISHSRQAASSQQSEDNRSVSSSRGWSMSEQARRLLKPEEILVLPADVALVFHKNLPVIPARLVKYFDAPEFARGGTGRSRPLGVSAVLFSACVLAFSLVAASLLACLPPPAALRQGMPSPAMSRTSHRPAATANRRLVPYRRPAGGYYGR